MPPVHAGMTDAVPFVRELSRTFVKSHVIAILKCAEKIARQQFSL